jgi:hypothetical protein
MQIGDLVRIATPRDPHLMGAVALVVWRSKKGNVLELHIPSSPNHEPSLYHIARLEKICK